MTYLAIAVIGLLAVTVVLRRNNIRVQVGSVMRRRVTTASGRTVDVLMPELHESSLCVVTFLYDEIDEDGITTTAAELLPIFAPEAEARGCSFIRIEPSKANPRAFKWYRSTSRTFQRGADGEWVPVPRD